ncbi:MAG: CAP domain-containing protein [Blastocatellia bacterium]
MRLFRLWCVFVFILSLASSISVSASWRLMPDESGKASPAAKADEEKAEEKSEKKDAGASLAKPAVEKALAPPVLEVNDLESRAFARINEVREAGGLPALQMAEDLRGVARAHSADMQARGYFAHVSPEGKDLRFRITRQGIANWRVLAENIAYNCGYEDPVQAAVEAWLNSPGHRRNIFSEKLTEAAIGVSISETGRVYFTHVFVTRDHRVMTARVTNR